MTEGLTYHQASGTLVLGPLVLGIGYSGAAEAKNNPAMEMIHDIGPIPKGCYAIGPPHNTLEHGPFVLALVPDPANQMYGRSGFLIHGDSKAVPGKASKGCIILSRDVREQIAKTPDKMLRVVE